MAEQFIKGRVILAGWVEVESRLATFDCGLIRIVFAATHVIRTRADRHRDSIPVRTMPSTSAGNSAWSFEA